MQTYNIMFADCRTTTMYADEIKISNKIISFLCKNQIIGYVFMTRHLDVTRYNFKDYEIVSMTRFTLQDDKIVEKTEEAS